MIGGPGTGRWSTAAPGAQHPLRHGLAFLLSGSTAFLIDAGLLELLTAGLGVDPIAARLVSISCALVAGWLSHRRFTFRLASPPTVLEFVRYVGVQSTVALLNYGFYVAAILLRPGIAPVLALFISSAIAMVFSYVGIRFGVFRQPGRGAPD